MTQQPVPAGGTFVYAVHCPDAGIFWYHDHVREDIALPMGLYGNLYVEPRRLVAAPRRARTAFLILSDLLLDGDSVVSPSGRMRPTSRSWGGSGTCSSSTASRAGTFAASAGEVVRALLTNVASARTYNVSIGDAQMKLIASDQGPYSREVMVPSIVIAPGERYVVDVRFDKPGHVGDGQ